MSAPFGASPEEWRQWDLTLGVTVDLLPVVCQPGLPIAPGSVLKSYGKVPSRFTSKGEVVGFPQWTSHQTTGDEITRWMADDRLGICLQTRRLRAIDIDIEDGAAVDAILDTLTVFSNFPLRRRANSRKCLLLFELEGDRAKQVLRTPEGVIELLMSGQQCLVAGSHPSGARYEWSTLYGTPFQSIPQLTDDEFLDLKHALDIFGKEDWTEGRPHKPRDLTQGTVLEDDVVRFLIGHGWVRS